MSLVSINLYYQFCPAVVKNLARFPATVAGSDVTSLVDIEGKCIPNAVRVSNGTDSGIHKIFSNF